jgi:hypothetical protein
LRANKTSRVRNSGSTFLVQISILSSLISGCATSNTLNLAKRNFSALKPIYTPITNETGELKFVVQSKYITTFKIKDVINPALLPEGRESMEEGVEINGMSTLVVHKMDSSGRIYDQIINYNNEVLLEVAPTIKVMNPNYNPSFTPYDNKFKWFVITDYKKGYIEPLSFTAAKEKLSDEQKLKMKDLQGIQFLTHQKDFVPGTPKSGGQISQKILNAYAQTAQPLSWTAANTFAMIWNGVNGPTLRYYSSMYFNPHQLNALDPSFQKIEVIDQSPQLIMPVTGSWRLIDERTKTFKFEGLNAYEVHPAMAIMQTAHDGKAEVRIISPAGYNLLVTKLETPDLDQAKKLVSEIDEARKVRESKMASYAEARPAIYANNVKANARDRALLVAEKGECYVSVYEGYLSPTKGGYYGRGDLILKKTRECTDYKSYYNLLKEISKTSVSLMNEKELMMLHDAGDAKTKARMQSAMETLRGNRSRDKMIADGIESRRQRDLYDAQLATQGAKNYKSGMGRQTREQSERNDQAYKAREAEKLQRQQLQKSLNRIGN